MMPWSKDDKLKSRLRGFSSWGPQSERNYKCTFCSREFKSAQALGGHMNVHRRDRARLRVVEQSPAPSSLANFFLTNTSNIPSSSTWSSVPLPLPPPAALALVLPCLSSSVPSRRDDEQAGQGDDDHVRSKKLSVQMTANGVWNKREYDQIIVRDIANDGLDLELRLGLSNYH